MTIATIDPVAGQDNPDLREVVEVFFVAALVDFFVLGDRYGCGFFNRPEPARQPPTQGANRSPTRRRSSEKPEYEFAIHRRSLELFALRCQFI
jgi:hypothetical protein